MIRQITTGVILGCAAITAAVAYLLTRGLADGRVILPDPKPSAPRVCP